MHRFFTMTIALATLVTAACAPDLTCSDPEPYQLSREAEKIEVPEDLNELPAEEELVIPRASPRDPRPRTAPCLDLPPTIQATSDED